MSHDLLRRHDAFGDLLDKMNASLMQAPAFGADVSQTLLKRTITMKWLLTFRVLIRMTSRLIMKMAHCKFQQRVTKSGITLTRMGTFCNQNAALVQSAVLITYQT